MADTASFTAFHGAERLVAGSLAKIVGRVHPIVQAEGLGTVLIFDDRTGGQVDVDFRGGLEDVLARLSANAGNNAAGATVEGSEAAARRGPGRPKLGVVAREVTLLPRHWEWLSSQPGGASATLRKLVEQARRSESGTKNVRLARESAFRFMNSMASDMPGFEEAARALFAGDGDRFATYTAEWPDDVRDYAMILANGAFATQHATRQ